MNVYGGGCSAVGKLGLARPKTRFEGKYERDDRAFSIRQRLLRKKEYFGVGGRKIIRYFMEL
jgi:hypothetical protein